MGNISQSIPIFLICVGILAIFDGIAAQPIKQDYESHSCKRDCLADPTPRRCEYNFTLEHYQTLSRACYSCPTEAMDCHRPHCVPADGHMRAIKVVNRMLPGPGLHVCKGDTVVVNVYNELGDFEGTSIHWHGILQTGSPHMDGVAMLTQCPIPVHSVFQYKFNANNAGTHYWHAHAGLQRGDGIFGSLIVRDTYNTSVRRLYDHDLPDHVVIVQDWLDQYASSKFSLHHHGMQSNEPSSILINGRGTLVGFGNSSMAGHNMDTMMGSDNMGEHDMNEMENMTATPPHHTHMASMVDVDHDHPDEETKDDDNLIHIPHSVFRVTKGKRYRFRFISNGLLNCPLKISIEGHNLTIIASDGNDVIPVEVESFTIFAGERYDVVVSANQKVGNYWMHVLGLGDCLRKQISQTAILRYDTAMVMTPHTGHSYNDGDRTGKHINPFSKNVDSITVSEMTSELSPDEIYSAHNVKKFYMAMDFNAVENYRYVDPDLYSLSTMMEMHTGSHANHLYALQMNHITFKMPTSPVLSQYEDVSEDIFCNETSVQKDCYSEFCECVHRIKVSHGDIVELVLVAEGRHGMGNHPMHLHGHSFYVLAMETLNKSISRQDVEILDSKGKIKRNLQNPIKKDTVMVPDGGYTIIRFKADNPGFWLFHCHVDFHFSLGMSIVIQVGEPHHIKTTPSNFPRCGNWRFTEDSMATRNTCTSAASHLRGQLFFEYLPALVLLMFAVLF